MYVIEKNIWELEQRTVPHRCVCFVEAPAMRSESDHTRLARQEAASVSLLFFQKDTQPAVPESQAVFQ